MLALRFYINTKIWSSLSLQNRDRSLCKSSNPNKDTEPLNMSYYANGLSEKILSLSIREDWSSRELQAKIN